MTPILYVIAPYLVIGAGAGVFYFAGLWWTVLGLSRVRRPALWSMGSFFLRTLIIMIVFFSAARGRWDRILICLAGFTLVRLFVLARMQPRTKKKKTAGAPALRMSGNVKG